MSMEKRPISILGQNERINERVKNIIEEMRSGATILGLRDLMPITPMDIQELEAPIGDEQLFQWAEVVLGQSLELKKDVAPDLTPEEEEKKRLEIEEIYQRLNKAYQNAKVFLRTTMGYEKEEVFLRQPTILDSKEKLLQLLRGMKVTKGEVAGLDQSIKYCRLVKATIAAFEAIRHDALFLESITKHFEESLVSETENEAPLRRVGLHRNGIEFLALDQNGSVINGIMSSRPKEFGGVLLRFINRPETNATTALKDGTGVRIIIDQEQAVRLIPIITDWLLEKVKAGRLVIENEGYLSEEQKTELLKSMSRSGISGESFEIEEGRPNRQSSKGFRTLKILGELYFSEQDASIVVRDSSGQNKTINEVSSRARRFEIQFLADLENENEKGPNNHFVYEAKRLITARTRLDGWCSEEAFLGYINTAAKESGIPSAQVKRYVLGDSDEGFFSLGEKVDPADVVELQQENKKIYVDFSVYERWKDHGIVSLELFNKLKTARKWHTLKPKEN